MSFDDFTDTETALRDSLARWLSDHVDLSQHARADAPAAASIWPGLVRDLGLTGVGLPEAVGGLGGGLRAQMVVLRTLGQALCAEPYLSCALVAAQALQRVGGPVVAEALAGIASGDAVVAWAHEEPGQRAFDATPGCLLRATSRGWRLDGRKRIVTAAPLAGHLLVSAHLDDAEATPALVWVDMPTKGLTRRDLRGLDGGWASEIAFDHCRLPRHALLQSGAEARATLDAALDAGALGVCAEALGVLDRLIADSLTHVRDRRQFGVPIASFQVLQHRLADMHLARAQAEALTWGVIDAWHDESVSPMGAAERALAVSTAKVTVGSACRTVGQGAVQLHGAMGVTEELPVGRFFRRATQIELLFGTSGQHLRRIDALQAA